LPGWAAATLVLAMQPSLSTDQLQLLFEAAAGLPEPATTRVLQDLGELRRLGLLSFDGGGRYEVTPQGRERLVAESPYLH
jgi:hypothetical protein